MLVQLSAPSPSFVIQSISMNSKQLISDYYRDFLVIYARNFSFEDEQSNPTSLNHDYTVATGM
jgi:hypothetical protein